MREGIPLHGQWSTNARECVTLERYFTTHKNFAFEDVRKIQVSSVAIQRIQLTAPDTVLYPRH